MLFSEEWLRHYINPALSSDELCETLTMGGLEVEGAEPIAPAFTGVIVAQVLTCDQHPNADKLHVCTVDIGKGEPYRSSAVLRTLRPASRYPAPPSAPFSPAISRLKKPNSAVSRATVCSAPAES